MEKKVVPEYEYMGLGLPITLTNIEFLKIHGQWYPKINVDKVANETFHVLLEKGAISFLTGKELEFIRIYLNMTKQAFGKKLNVAHTTILRWEKLANKVPKTRKDHRAAIQELKNVTATI
jgi:DNA-binding transcriptional regulator YiaG